MSERLAKKVLLVGWDAADWKFIHPLLDQGLMPAMEKLVNEGVMGNLATLRPILSPLVWNSIATGKLPDKHGILNFVEPDPVGGGLRPVSSTSRKVKAIWNILHQSGLRSHVIGWFAGHPAEPINGISVSPLFQHAGAALDKPWPLPDGAVHPASLRETFAGLRLHPAELTEAALLPFVPRAAEIDQEKDPRLAMLARMLAECCSVHNAVTWILEHQEWDFLAVCYDAIDHFCHAFAPYHPPRMEGVPERDFEIYKDVVAGAYRFHDMMLERLLDLAGPDVTVLLVSDHGFHSDHLRPRKLPHEPAAAAAWHRPFGVFSMKGPHIRRDEPVYGASILDITPTVLALFGLPVGRDMDGKVLAQAFEQPPRIDTIPGWEEVPGECGMHPAEVRMDPDAAQALIRQFVALGYLEPPTEGTSKLLDLAAQESRFNLAQTYLDSRRPREAVPVLEELVAQKPAEARFALALAQCRLSLGQKQEARSVLQPLLEDDKIRPWAEWLLAVTELGDARPEDALLHLAKAEEENPGTPALHVRTGNTYLRLRRFEDAERAFTKALTIDADNPYAHLGLALVGLRGRRYADAAREALEAVGLRYFFPAGHYFLGVALARLGQFDRAAVAFETAVSMQPGLGLAHRWLVNIHSRPGGDLGKAALHRALLHQLRRRREAAAGKMSGPNCSTGTVLSP